MASPRPLRIRFLAFICVVACAASAGAGWETGWWGAELYGVDSVSHTFKEVIPPPIGGWVGGCSAMIACLLWCRLIVPMSLHRIAGLRSTAALAGLGAGVLASILLHATLMITEGTLRLNALAVGLGMGAPVGLLLGVIGGHLCRLAVTTERAFRLPQGRRPLPYDGPIEPDFMDQLDVRSRPRSRPDFRDEYDA